MEQFNLEDQRHVRWDVAARSIFAICKLGGNEHFRLLADRHLRDGLIPPLDDLASAESEREAVVRIEHFAAHKVAFVIDSDWLQQLWLGAVAGSNDFFHKCLLVDDDDDKMRQK